MDTSLTPQSSPPPKSRAALWITLWSLLCLVGIGGGAGGFAILIATTGKVQERARRTIDSSNLRQIAQAALIWANDHDGKLPPVHLTTSGRLSKTNFASVHSVAATLAREGGLDDASVWSSPADPHDADTMQDLDYYQTVLSDDESELAEEFSVDMVLACDFATGLDTALPTTTPIAWTRGLREDGTWDPATAVYGGDGGHIVFLGGNVTFYQDLKTNPLRRADGQLTSNILEALPPNARVVGIGPGTLHGTQGKGPSAP
jgi:hypothetical protein